MACQRANSPRVDDVPFCSSCVEAGWGVAFVRGVQAAVKCLGTATSAPIGLISDEALGTLLQLCDCGETGRVTDLLVQACDWFRQKSAASEDVTPQQWSAFYESNRPLYEELEQKICSGNTTLYWLVLYTLDRLKLVEHGSVLGSGWLTRRGEHLLSVAAQLKEST